MDFFGFLSKQAQDFAGGVGNTFKAAGDVGFNFLKSATTPSAVKATESTVKKQQDEIKNNPFIQQRLREDPQLAAQLPQAPSEAPSLPNIITDSLQAIPRAIKSTGLTVRNQDSYTPNGDLEKLLYGDRPIKNLTGSGKDIYSAGGALVSGGKNIKAGEDLNPVLATGLGLVGATLDAIPVNPLKAGGKVVVDQLVKDTTESAVKKTLAGKISPQILDRVAPSIALTKDPNIIQSILDRETTRIPPPQVITRAPTESSELSQLVDRGKINDRTEVVPINSLKLGSDTAGSFDKSQIKSYLDDIKAQKTIDPVVVSEKDGQFFVQDGKHRLIAMKQAGVQDVPIVREIPKGGPTLQRPLNGAALQSSMAANTVVPLPRSSITSEIKPQSITEATIPKANPPADPLDEISSALSGKPAVPGQSPTRGLETVSAENKRLLSTERGQRFTASEGAGKTAAGSQGYFNELSQLKGEYSKVKLGGMIENLGPDKAEQLFSRARDKIQAIPDSVYQDLGYFPKSARLNTQTAIRKVIFGEGGGVPTASEIKLIRTVAPKLADNIESKIPKNRKLLDLAAQLSGIPRALQSSFDLSMGGRQGLLVAARHPVLWGRANKESIKYLKDPKYFNNQMSAIRNTPEYALGDKYGLATPAASKGSEEAYASSQLAEKIPIAGKAIKASERAYDGGLTKLRSDLWAKALKAYGGVDDVEKKLGPKGMQDLAEAINTLTGRGGKKGGFIEKRINTLSETLFAPRLWAARLNTLNPAYYARLSPAARKVALENAGSFAAVAGVVLGAAAALGGEVETDPRSSDFLKIKFGDTRYDIFGGLQQNMVFAWREITGEKKSTQTGDITKFAKSIPDILTNKTNEQAGVDTGMGKSDRLTIAADMFTNKLAPIPAAVVTQLEGKDRGGNEINPIAEIAKLFVPINVTGIYDTTQDTGSLAQGVGLNAPSFFGIGTQTYGVPSITLSDKQKGIVQQLKDNGAPPEQVEATTRFYQTLKTAPNRNKVSENINKALAAGNQDEAIQIAKDYNQKYAGVFTDWVKKYKDYASDEDLLKEYTSGKIKLTNASIQQRLKSIKDNPTYAGK